MLYYCKRLYLGLCLSHSALAFPTLGRVENVPRLDLPWGRYILRFVGDWYCGAGTERVEEIGLLLCVEGILVCGDTGGECGEVS